MATEYLNNPQIRQWSPADIENARLDPWLGTLLLNAGTYSAEMMRARHGVTSKRYLISFQTCDYCEEIYAVDDAMAIRFAHCQYTGIKGIEEITTTITYRPVA